MKIALLCNVRPGQPGDDAPDDLYEEYDSESTIEGIARPLRALEHEVEPVAADLQLPWRLNEGKFDFVFNIAEGKGGRCREAVPAAVCELMGLPLTGPDALTLGLTLDKFLAKRVVSPDVPVAPGILVENPDVGFSLQGLQYPVIVKPNDEGSSKGIREGCVCSTAAAAVERCGWLRKRYMRPVLVEEFLPAQEVTVAVAGNEPGVRILGMMEIAPRSSEEHFVYSLEVKRDYIRRVRYHVPPRLEPKTIGLLQDYALKAYRLLGCRDIARMDFRLDRSGLPRFIECNPLPGLDPVNSDIVILSKDIVPYDKLVQGILHDAMRRFGC